ncbi:uncharacterized protein DS421_17g581920 [Arachis hypogaea]|nr:uncharacterized protein DS421_17g581920 [Arachis hypogaea]
MFHKESRATNPIPTTPPSMHEACTLIFTRWVSGFFHMAELVEPGAGKISKINNKHYFEEFIMLPICNFNHFFRCPQFFLQKSIYFWLSKWFAVD